MEKLRSTFPILLTVFMFLYIGCMSDEANRYYLSEKLPAKEVKDVEVLKEGPQRSYTVIADFQACNASFNHMRKRAAEIGADAVIIVPAGGWYSTNEVWADKDRQQNSYSRLIGTAIKYDSK